MSDPATLLALAIVALVGYGIGSISSGYIVGKIYRNVDLRTVGSGSTGATNAFRTLGRVGLLVAILDILKGVAAVGGAAAIVGTLYDYTAFTYFRSAVPLALMGFAGAAASAFVTRQRGFRMEPGPERPRRIRPISIAYGLGLGALLLTAAWLMRRFLLSSALLVVLAQRLGRRICRDCRQPIDGKEEDLVPYGHVPQGLGRVQFYKGKGCPACNFTGMKGRVAIYEVMPITEVLRDMILKSAATGELRGQAQRDGMKTLRQAGLLKVLEGTTTVEEVLRVTLS